MALKINLASGVAVAMAPSWQPTTQECVVINMGKVLEQSVMMLRLLTFVAGAMSILITLYHQTS